MSEGKPSPPKRPLSAFFLYKEKVLRAVRADNPQKKITQITKIISEKWAKVEGEERDQIIKEAEELKKNYKKDVYDYVEKYGKPPARKRKVTKPKDKKRKVKKERKPRKKKEQSEQEQADHQEEIEDVSQSQNDSNPQEDE